MPAERSTDDQLARGWVPLENRLYRRDVLYKTLGWTLTPKQIGSGIIAIAPCGGPFAIVPDAGYGLDFALAIYTLSGRLLQRYDRLRNKTGQLFQARAVALGWSVKDVLSIVYNDGVVLRLPGGRDSNESTSISVIQNGREDLVHDAAILSSGEIVIRCVSGVAYGVSSDNQYHCISSNAKPPEGVAHDSPNAGIDAIGSESSQDGNLHAFLVTENGNIVLAGTLQPNAPVKELNTIQISVSHNREYIAAIESENGDLVVCSSNLSREVMRTNLVAELSVLGVENTYTDAIFDAKAPEQIAWVGSDSLALLYKEHLVLLGPRGGVVVLPLGEKGSNGAAILQTEKDGLRFITASSSEFIQLVDDSLSAVCCQVQAPGYKLLRSSDAYLPWAKAQPIPGLTRYRLLRELRDSGRIHEAARVCVKAAYLEPDVEVQKQLLRAAAYGQRHSTVFPNTVPTDAEEVLGIESTPQRRRELGQTRRDVNMVPTAIAILRVLNAAAKPDAGLPLTKPQFDTLGLTGLVERLARYEQFTLALRIATYGGVSAYTILLEWAMYILREHAGKTDDQLADIITKRFEVVNNARTGTDLHGSRRSRALPYVKVAEAAYHAKRSRCAELLLRRETRPAPKVAMYLHMGREAPAIVSAVSSGDPELILDSLRMVMEKKNSVRETARLLRSLPPTYSNRACDLLASHLKQIGDLKNLRVMYSEIGRRREAALVEIYAADQIENSRERMVALEKAATVIGKGHNRLSCHFEAQALQHAAAVASSAIDLEKKTGLPAESLRYAHDGDLLARVILDVSDSAKRRDMLPRLKRELRVPERRFFWVCLHSMAEAGDFQSIEALSGSATGKIPPIGLTAFVDTCLKYHMDDEAVKYAVRIADPRERARALARCGRGREAADIALRLRNQQLQEEVQELASRHVSSIKIPLSE